MNSQISAAAFLNWVDGWYAQLPSVSLRADVLAEGAADSTAVLVVDLLVGFCSEGPLSSPRVGALGPRAADFLKMVRAAGVRHLLLASDAHPADSPEFHAFPPHCVRGTREADTIPELTGLPFAADLVNFPKGSVNVGIEPEFQAWMDAHPEVTRWVLVGDCTDLCIYHAAMHLRTRANSTGRDLEIWVAADLVDTYDLPVDVATSIGALPHDASLLHRIFLYHLALNGIRVVKSIAA